MAGSEGAGEPEFSGNCFVAMDEELGAHRFVYVIAPRRYAEACATEAVSSEEILREFASEIEQCARARLAMRSEVQSKLELMNNWEARDRLAVVNEALSETIGPIWRGVNQNATSIDTGAVPAADFLNELIRSKSIKELYEMASTYGPLGLSDDDGSWTARSGRAPYIYSGQFTARHLKPPSVANLLYETRYMSLTSSREYPGAAKRIADISGFGNRLVFASHCSSASLSEPVADWVLLRNLLQAVGRIQSGEFGVGAILEADYGWFSCEMPIVDAPRRTELRDSRGWLHKDLWDRSYRHWYVERIGTMCPEGLEGAQEALKGSSISSEDGIFSRSVRLKLHIQSRAAEAWFESCYPAFAGMFRSYASFVPLEGREALALDLASWRRGSYSWGSRSGERPAAMHLLFGCQPYAKLLKEKLGFALDEDGIYLAVDCPAVHEAEDTCDETEDAIRKGTISSLYYHVLENCQIDFNAMSELTRRDELGPGEVVYAPRTLMDKAIFALLGHRGRRLIVCKNCGRISLAPAQGKPRQFCSASCQHMYAKKNAK